MAVKIRMQRNGRHKLASYRIVVADSRYPRDGRFIEILGYYDTWTSSDCDYHLSGTSISLPGYWKWLTYSGWMSQEIDKKIIRALYEKGLIKIHQIR